MHIVDCCPENGEILLTIGDVSPVFSPYLFKRITPNIYKYFDVRIPLAKKTDDIYALPLEALLPYLHEDSFIRCDFIGFKEDNESTCPLTYLSDVSPIDGSFDCKYGTISYQLYKNNTQQLSLYVTFTAAFRFEISAFAKDPDALSFRVTTGVPMDYEVYLMRRTNLQHDFSYNAEIRLDVSPLPDGDHLVIAQEKGLLRDYCQAGSEIWDIVAKTNDLLFPVESKTIPLSAEYFTINDDFQAKFFVSEKKYASVYTKYNASFPNRKITIGIMGSCYSKEVFHSTHTNKDYKRYYENTHLWFHQSLIALMSPPVPYNERDFHGHYQKELNKYAKPDFEKNFLAELKKDTPDYLIIDNYIEIAALLYETLDHSFITESFYLADTPALKNMKTVHKYGISNEKRFALFKDAVDRFAVEIQKILPQERIILLRSQPALQKEEKGIISDFPEKMWLQYIRKLWERNDNYLLKKLPSIHVIDTRSKNFISQQLEGLTFSFNHLQHEYYRMILDEINKIALLDILKGKLR